MGNIYSVGEQKSTTLRARAKRKPKPEPLPPSRVFVSWCITCGTVIFADEVRTSHSNNSCPSCPHGEGQVRSAVYRRVDYRPPK